MPARREKIYICPRENGQLTWVFDLPIWWDRRAFFEKFGEREIDTGNPIYVDYGILLTASEAKAWDERCRDEYAKAPHSQKPYNSEVMSWLESRLEDASWVIVESYEWESGLD
jgi:hypothetical protein